jgi:polysaccharide pyruvyl transferase WcaK-like protein
LEYMKEVCEHNLLVKAVSQRYQFTQAIKALCRSDLFLIGGGTPLYEDRFHLVALWLLTTIARACGVCLMTYAISARPIRDPFSRFLCRRVLHNIPLLTVREPRAAGIIKDLLGDPAREVELYTDPVVAFRQSLTGPLPDELEGLVRQVSECGIDVVAIFPRFLSSSHAYHVHHYEPLASETIDNYYRTLAHVCDRLGERATLLFLPMNTEDPDNDRVAINSVRDRMQPRLVPKTIVGEITPGQIVPVLSSCRLVLGARLHSLVFAAVARTPMVAISYGPKIEGFMQTLGLADLNHPVQTLGAEELWASSSRAWNQAAHLRSHLFDRMASLEILAGENADRAVGLVGASTP